MSDWITYPCANVDWSQVALTPRADADDADADFSATGVFSLRLSGTFTGYFSPLTGELSANLPVISGVFGAITRHWGPPPTVTLWLDASDDSTVFLDDEGDYEGRVAGWRSKTSNNYYAISQKFKFVGNDVFPYLPEDSHAQYFSPTRGEKSVVFDGTQYLHFYYETLDLFRNLDGYSIFVVYKRIGGSSSNTLFEFSYGSSSVERVHVGARYLKHRDDGGSCWDNVVAFSFPEEERLLNTAVADLNALTLYAGSDGDVTLKNDHLCPGPTADTRSENGWLGREYSTASYYYLTGEINEILVFPEAVPEELRQRIEGYLAWKWGVQAKLPVAHPYSSEPPKFDYATGILEAPIQFSGSFTGGVKAQGLCKGFIDADITGQVEGIVAPIGLASAVIPPPRGFFYGRLPVFGRLSGTISPLVGQAEGYLPSSGVLIGTLQPLEGVLSGGTDVVGVGSGTIPSIRLETVGGTSLRGLFSGQFSADLSGRFVSLPRVFGGLSSSVTPNIYGAWHGIFREAPSRNYFSVADTMSCWATYSLGEYTSLVGKPHVFSELLATFHDTTALVANLYYIAPVASSDALELTDDLTYQITRLAFLATTLNMQSETAATTEMTDHWSDGVRFNSELALVFRLLLEEQAALDAVLQQPTLYCSAAETVYLTSLTANEVELTARLRESSEFFDAYSVLARLVLGERIELTETFVFDRRVARMAEVLLVASRADGQLDLTAVTQDALVLQEKATFAISLLQAAGFSLTDDLKLEMRRVLVAAERLHLTAKHLTANALLLALNEDVRLRDAYLLLLRVSLGSAFDLADATNFSIERLTLALSLAETLTLATRHQATIETMLSLIELITLTDGLENVEWMSMEERLTAADSIRHTLLALVSQPEALSLIDTMQRNMVFVAKTPEALQLINGPSTAIEVLLRAREVIAFVSHLPLGDEDYQAWVLNSDSLGVTEYTNWPFNSLANTRQATFGLTDTGLYELTGDDDDGDPIQALLRTGDLEFGTSDHKRIDRAYLYLTSTDDIFFKTISTYRGQRNETFYRVDYRMSADDGQTRRVRLGKGNRGTTWAFELTNIDGGDFDVRGAEVLPVKLTRKI